MVVVSYVTISPSVKSNAKMKEIADSTAVFGRYVTLSFAVLAVI